MPAIDIVFSGVTDALLAWQESADPLALEHVIRSTRRTLERTAADMLRRLHIGDWSAVDDTLSLVFDHLRRLPAAPAGGRLVARFDGARQSSDAGDAGIAYLVWLARERARDVARTRRRQAARGRPFSAVGHVPDDRDREGKSAAPGAPQAAHDEIARLHAAVAQLDPRLRCVVEMLLEGKSQVVIAHVLGVCEGTVSRLRARAIAELRRVLS